MRYVNLSNVLVYRLVSQKVEARFPTYESLINAKLMLPSEVSVLNSLVFKKHWKNSKVAYLSPFLPTYFKAYFTSRCMYHTHILQFWVGNTVKGWKNEEIRKSYPSRIHMDTNIMGNEITAKSKTRRKNSGENMQCCSTANFWQF